MADFESALTEVRPAFGVSSESLQACRMFGIIDYGAHFTHVTNTLRGLVNQCKTSDRTPLLSCMLEGPPGSGKTALAATLALESDFFFVRMISPNDLVGYSEASKCQVRQEGGSFVLAVFSFVLHDSGFLSPLVFYVSLNL